MSQHALLSPSSASRWMRCPASVALSKGIPDRSSKWADEGTLAHEVAALMLVETFVSAPDASNEMIQYVKCYETNVRRIAGPHATIFVEQKLPLERITGEAGAEGTGDAVVITADGDELQLHDLKYGKGVEVVAEDNEQLQIYALAALEKYQMFGAFQRVRLVIHQVRLREEPDEWVIPIEQLVRFGHTVREKAARARMLMNGSHNDADLRVHIVPGEKQCRFCRAAATCPGIQDTAVEAIGVNDFADVTPSALEESKVIVSSADTERLAKLLPLVPLIENWCNAISERARLMMLEGHDIPGFKLVEGKRGNRQWLSETQVEEILKSMRLTKDEMYAMKLISPSAAEKLLKNNPKRWNRLTPYIARADGKPIITHAYDKRPAISMGERNDFADLTAED